MKPEKLSYFLALTSVLVLSGCAARTYSLDRDRVDQDMSAGNHGYLSGKAPAEESKGTKKSTREIRVFEVELGRPYKAEHKQEKPQESSESQSLASTSEVTSEGGINELLSNTEQAPLASVSSQKYTVEKNDTLQKISKKFYGTTKKWTKIYNANKDVLKSPNSVYPGQTLNIPDVSETKAPVETLKEPKENLK